MTSAERVPIAAFLPANMDGCALYRMFIPHLNMPGSRFVFKPGGVGYEKFAEAEVVVVQRQVSEANYQALRDLRSVGLKIIYDTDDNLWAIQAANPHKELFEIHQDGFAKCALACDLITVSTRGLRSGVTTAVPQFKGEVLVCPNAMDFTLFQDPVERDPDRVVIGWAGSNTHGEDVKEAWEVLPEILRAHDNVYLEFVGQMPPMELIGHPRVKLRRFVPVGEFPSRFASWGWDITMAPLTDNRFNRSKSNIKMLEAASLRIPILVSRVQPYQEFCAMDSELDWLLCSAPIQWKLKLTKLINEPETRKYYADRIRHVAETWYSIDKIKHNWIHAVRQALLK